MNCLHERIVVGRLILYDDMGCIGYMFPEAVNCCDNSFMKFLRRGLEAKFKERCPSKLVYMGHQHIGLDSLTLLMLLVCYKESLQRSSLGLASNELTSCIPHGDEASRSMSDTIAEVLSSSLSRGCLPTFIASMRRVVAYIP